MSYIGCLVSLNCGDVLGTYQGRVKKIDNSSQLLTLTQPFRNGIVCEVPEVTISACDIKELKIVKTAEEAAKQLPKSVTPSKLSKETAKEYDWVASPVCVRELENKTSSCATSLNFNGSNGHKSEVVPRERSKSASARDRQDQLSFNGQNCQEDYNSGYVSPLRNTPTKEHTVNGYRNGGQRYDESMNGGRNCARYTPTKDDIFRSRRNSSSEGRSSQKVSMPKKIEFKKRPQSKQDCFSAPAESILDDFDFEKNLALFDKKAVFKEIEDSNPDAIKICDKKPTKYRCDENVLQGGPVVLQQIKLPGQSGPRYVTDTGLVVPSVDYDLRNKLFDMAEACGFSSDRRLEMIGRSSSEMVLQLLGGSSRLNPKNGHQIPTVVVLCGPHIQGAQGLNCARHLVNHGVQVIVFLPNFLRMVSCVEQELKMFQLCNGKRYSNPNDIPTCSVDMIVNCLDSHENSFLKDQAWYQAHVTWVGHSRAPVFTIDPPIEFVDIVPKWCLYPVLPLAKTDVTSQLYMCDLGFPKKVFSNVGITYRSPFSHKFIIALHPQT